MRLNFDDFPMRNRRKVIFSIVTVLVILVGILAFFLFFPHLLSNQKLINVQYLDNTSNPRVVALYQEEGSSDDGSYLAGYWLYLLDPTTNKTLDKLFLKRYDTNFPPKPTIHYTLDHEIWIIGDKGMYQGDVGYNALIKINNDKLTITPTPFLQGWIVNGFYKNTLSLVNQYNETGCWDLTTHEIVVPGCKFVEDTASINHGCFFFVKNTASSTRSHLYYYSSSNAYPPPGVFAGFVEEGKPIPGWHLPDLISMQNGTISQVDLETYQTAFDSTEKARMMDEKQLFNSPYKIFEKDGICILIAYDDQSNLCSFYEFQSSGKLVWKIACPTLRKQTSAVSSKCIYKKKETLIINPENWVISVDNTSGKLNWQCPK